MPHPPTATYHTANRERLAWPAIEQLVGIRKALRNDLVHRVERWQIQPLHALDVGSTRAARATSRVTLTCS